MTSFIYKNASSPDDMEKIDPALAELYRKQDYIRDNEKIVQAVRVRLCDQMSTILEGSQSDVEREMAADILLVLLRQAQRDLKLALSDRLSVIENVPLRLVLRFVHDDIEVADPVLRQSKSLNDLDLMYIIQSFGTRYWQAIASRGDLSEIVMDTLVEKNDLETLKTLAENKGVTLTEFAAATLAELAITNEKFSRPLLARSDIPENIVRKLYLYVGQELKKYIEEKFNQNFLDVVDDVDDVVSEFSMMSGNRFLPTPTMMRAAEAFARQDKLKVPLMVETAKRGQVSSFVAQFCRFSGLSVGEFMAMLEQGNGRDFARVAREAGFERHDFLSIFMMTRHVGKSTPTSLAADVDEALRWYDQVVI